MVKLSFLITLISIFLLAGCSTPHELKKTKPRISYVTTRSANHVMKCIRDKWREHLTPVYEEKLSGGDGWQVRHDDVTPNATIALVTIQGTEPEVHVNYYTQTNRIRLHRLEEEVVDCKD